MTNVPLHIVCLDAPEPPDYGGAIDMYYKIEALAKAGNKIILHYFAYKQHLNINVLRTYCTEVHAYSRKKFFSPIPFLPFIVSSRINQQLIERLNRDDYPILLEGIHCTGVLPYINNKQRKIVVRIHNNEAAYYEQLAKAEKDFFKKMYYSIESKLLKNYQENLPYHVHYTCLSSLDEAYFNDRIPSLQVSLLPCFIPWQILDIKSGAGSYCLYHGNLSVVENEAAVEWLIQHVFSKMEVPFVIAGKNASEKLMKFAGSKKNISIKNNPTENELDYLIRNAHIHILPSLNNTGVKLKLLHALSRGRFCITNTAGLVGSGIGAGVYIANSIESYIKLVEELMQHTFTAVHIEQRQPFLQLYNNNRNVQQLIQYLQ